MTIPNTVHWSASADAGQNWDRLIPALQSLPIIGLAGLASYALAKLAFRSGLVSYYRYAVVAMLSSAMPPMPRSITVREIAPDELANHLIDVPPTVQADRFAQGMTCLGAFNARQELLGVTWVGTGAFTEDLIAVRFAVPPRSCWDTGLWIAPEHRLGRAFAALWAGTRAWMEARGLDTSYSRITDHNIASIGAHRRMGARFLGHYVFLRIGSWQFSLATRPRLLRSHQHAALFDVGRLL